MGPALKRPVDREVRLSEVHQDRAAALVDGSDFTSVEAVLVRGVELVEEEARKLAYMRQVIQESLAQGGENTSEDLMRICDEMEADLIASGLRP